MMSCQVFKLAHGIDLFPAVDFVEDIKILNCHGNKKQVVADGIETHLY